MSSLEKLDNVLNTINGLGLSENGDNPMIDSLSLFKILFEKYNSAINPKDFWAILIKLDDDRNIKMEEDGTNSYTLFSHFNGIMLQESGGYKSISEMAERQKKTQTLKDWLLIFGSWVAGIGTLALFVVEILKQFVWTANH